MLLLAREGYQEIAEEIIVQAGIKVKICLENKYEIRAASDISLVSSGTATLEGAIVGTPMVVVYKVSFLTALVARLLIKIPNIALVNVVAGKRIVPELVQQKLTPYTLAKEALNLLTTPEKFAEIKIQLAEVKNKLGSPGASFRAAQSILNYLSSK